MVNHISNGKLRASQGRHEVREKCAVTADQGSDSNEPSARTALLYSCRASSMAAFVARRVGNASPNQDLGWTPEGMQHQLREWAQNTLLAFHMREVLENAHSLVTPIQLVCTPLEAR